MFLLLFLQTPQGNLQIVEGITLTAVHGQGSEQLFSGLAWIPRGQQGRAGVIEGLGFQFLVIGQGQGPFELDQGFFVTFQPEKSFAHRKSYHGIFGILDEGGFEIAQGFIEFSREIFIPSTSQVILYGQDRTGHGPVGGGQPQHQPQSHQHPTSRTTR